MLLAWALYAGLVYTGAIYQPRAEDPSILITFGAGPLLRLCVPTATTRGHAQMYSTSFRGVSLGERYANVYAGDDRWKALEVKQGDKVSKV